MGMCHIGLVYVGHVQSVEMGEECRMWLGVCGYVPHGTGLCRTCSVCGDGRGV